MLASLAAPASTAILRGPRLALTALRVQSSIRAAARAKPAKLERLLRELAARARTVKRERTRKSKDLLLVEFVLTVLWCGATGNVKLMGISNLPPGVPAGTVWRQGARDEEPVRRRLSRWTPRRYVLLCLPATLWIDCSLFSLHATKCKGDAAAEGSTSSACAGACEKGKYGIDGKTCQDCAMGYYGAEEGMTDPKCSGRCADDSVAGSTSCLQVSNVQAGVQRSKRKLISSCATLFRLLPLRRHQAQRCH